MLIKIMSGIIGVGALIYILVLMADAWKHKESFRKEKGSVPILGIAEIVVWFIAAFGVSDTAMNMLVYRIRKTVDTAHLPGTIIVGATIPMCVMSVAYLNAIDVDPLTLLAIVAFQSLGAFAGSALITRLNLRAIRIIMGSALLGTSFLIFAKQFLLHMDGGMAQGLTIPQLILACLITFLLGALNLVGFGSTTPAMSMLMMMGMSPLAIYPIIMAANSFGCLVSCATFVRKGAYLRKPALVASIGGTIGVLLAVRMVSDMNLVVLQMLMILVLIYSAVSILKENKTEKN